MPAPTVIRRSQMACLIREWRNDPYRQSVRNFPTVSDLMGMVIRKNFEFALGQTLDLLAK